MNNKARVLPAALLIIISACIMLIAYSATNIFVLGLAREWWHLPICLAIIGVTLLCSRRISTAVVLSMLMLAALALSNAHGSVSRILFYITAIDLSDFLSDCFPYLLHFVTLLLMSALAISALYRTRLARLWYIPAVFSAVLLTDALFFGGFLGGGIFIAVQYISDLFTYSGDDIAAELSQIAAAVQNGALIKYGLSFFTIVSPRLPFISDLAASAAQILSIIFVCAQYIGYILLARWLYLESKRPFANIPKRFEVTLVHTPSAAVLLLVYAVTQLTANLISKWLYCPLYDSSFYLPLAVLFVGLILCLRPKPSAMLTVSLIVLLAWVYQSIDGVQRADRIGAYEDTVAACLHAAVIVCFIILSIASVIDTGRVQPIFKLWFVPAALAAAYTVLTLITDVTAAVTALEELSGYEMESIADELGRITDWYAAEISRRIENRHFLNFEYITSQSGVISVWAGVITHALTVIADLARGVGYIVLARWFYRSKQ